MIKYLIILSLFISSIGFGQVGQWDSTEAIIYPTDTTGKIVLAAGDTIYLINVSPSDSGLNYINRRSLVKMIYDFDQDATDDTIVARKLFQNYDFDSLFYSRINGNKISEIEVYSSATDRVGYFNVPYDPSTGIIVDYTGGGDYTTINAAVLATAGNIFIKSGTYDENSGSSYLNLPNTEYLIGVGNVTVTSASTTTGIAIRGNGTIIKNIEFDAEGNTTNMVVFVSTGTNSTLENCYVHSFTNSAVFHTYYNDQFIGCVFESNNSNYVILSNENYSMTFDNCYFTGTLVGYQGPIYNFTANDTSTTTITNCEFKMLDYEDRIYIGSCALDFRDNIINYDSLSCVLFTFNTSNLVPTISFKGNDFNISKYDNDAKFLNISYDTFNIEIDSNNFDFPATGEKTFVLIQDVDTLSVNRFNIRGNSANINLGGFCSFRNFIYPGYVNLENNDLNLLSGTTEDFYFTSFILMDTLSPVTISKNKITGIEGSAHAGIYMADVEKSTIIHNKITGFGLASVIDKGKGLVKSNSTIQYNDLTDLLIKGIKKEKIYNNYIHGSTMYGLWIYKNVDPGVVDGFADSNEFKNNIVNSDTCFYINQVDTIFSDHNVVYGNIIAYNGISTYNWAQWQALGYDINSYNQDPLLNANGVPNTGSVAIGNGLNLGSPYNFGLIPNATFPNPSLLPQKAKWIIGAYVVPLGVIAVSNMKIVIGNGGKIIYY